MKLNKLSIDGNTNSLEITDKILPNKINKKLISEILYKNIANFKKRKAKTKQKDMEHYPSVTLTRNPSTEL